MAGEKKDKKKIRPLLWAGFVLIVLVAGLGPLALVLYYTRDMNPDFLDLLHRGPRQEVETAPGLPEREPYLVQYLYRYCDHHALYEPESIPPELELPPPALVEMAVALHESNTSIQSIMSHLQNTAGWYVADIRAGAEGSYFTFTYLDDLCPHCEGRYYLGIFNNGSEDVIAVFEGRPPGGKMIETTPHKVRDDIREELEEGVVLHSLDELHEILQEYTS
ncbi:MAG: hypothetical protein GX878_01205 [Firmicutes bacterium]|nr:hypothetical protein [Bacillota bacterium]